MGEKMTTEQKKCLEHVKKALIIIHKQDKNEVHDKEFSFVALCLLAMAGSIECSVENEFIEHLTEFISIQKLKEHSEKQNVEGN